MTQWGCRGFLLAVGFLLVLAPVGRAQQTDSFEESTRKIRIKKIATEWQGSHLTLHLHNGEIHEGLLLKVSGTAFHLQSGQQELEIPLGEVTMVSFDPGLPELLLTVASSLMGSAFIGGGLMLIYSDAKQDEVGIAAFLGLCAGGLWGYSNFYISEEIQLE